MSGYGKYSDERDEDTGKKICLKDFKNVLNMAEERLALVREKPEVREAMSKQLNITRSDYEGTVRATEDMGQWISDYMLDNGYHPGEASIFVRHVVRKAFPTIARHGVVTPENIEARLILMTKLLNRHISLEESDLSSEAFGLFSKRKTA